MRSPYFPARTVLFHKEPNGVTYRVPALLFLSRSRSFLAFCEERLSPSDSQAHLLVMRKGTFYRNYVEVSVSPQVEDFYSNVISLTVCKRFENLLEEALQVSFGP